MSIWDNIYFWRKPPEKTIIPYKPGYDPSMNPIKPSNKNNVSNIWQDLKPIDLTKIHPVAFPSNKYFHEVYDKTQIVLHHTISGDGIDGDISTWEHDPANVAVCILIDRAGIPWQLFSSKFWAYHLGAGNHWLDRHSIAIEIDNWGWLQPGDGKVQYFNHPPKPIQTQVGKYYAYYGNVVNANVQNYPSKFRGYNYFEKYTMAQIRTVGELLLYWNKMYNIPLTYKPEMWDVSTDALAGKSGVWTHVSYRPINQKSDCHPQPELIEMLQTLDRIK